VLDPLPQFKKASKNVQLKVGHMNVQLFDGPAVLGSWLVQHMTSWEYDHKQKVFTLHIKVGGKDAKKKKDEVH
jgi:hypothetical protein